MFFFFNDTATTEIYTLSLHDALPILHERELFGPLQHLLDPLAVGPGLVAGRSEEHTSELQSQSNLVCRLLLEKNNLVMLLASDKQYPAAQLDMDKPISLVPGTFEMLF